MCRLVPWKNPAVSCSFLLMVLVMLVVIYMEEVDLSASHAYEGNS